MSIVAAAILLFMVMDPLGNIPVFLALLSRVSDPRRRWVVFRESLIALVVLLLIFLFAGPGLLGRMHLSEESLFISGGIVLFLIALRMIFRQPGGIFGDEAPGTEEPLIVPLAIPLIAGPSAMATVMLLATQHPERRWHWVLALLAAWFFGLCILLVAPSVARLFGRQGILAAQRLMGMILTVIAVQMFLNGIQSFVHPPIAP